ncbi:MAG TPA: DUF480 domain-containing protein, partial [Thermoanaerobaculia bacterium]
TPGELRTRSERMHPFSSFEEVEEALRRLAAIDEPLVRDLPRRPGQKEIRWIHLVGELAPEPEPKEVSEPPEALLAPARPALSSRVDRLEELVERLAADLEELKKQLGS